MSKQMMELLKRERVNVVYFEVEDVVARMGHGPLFDIGDICPPALLALRGRSSSVVEAEALGPRIVSIPGFLRRRLLSNGKPAPL